ncbi:hypothetical protein, variant 3 [Aphanomyces astaci]|uniref:Uncharacterized protein n=2 Tax=Aphanomyces astaci TaxID=112090 RepID=W4GEZ9_APHAT|nr:hypothetical protein, variant 3 [Aphanomyces astaci]ETV77851.1 hypothetical protein, variant 3 [Aphanomyces astaci]|eukprot:XP_009832972.1 hypothetical protein, variant 3 [Aphanomyces astaci]
MDRPSNSLQPRSAGERQHDDAIEREDRPQLLPVTSRIYCTFSDCLQCTHGFNDSYLRSYRPNGLKVLRCFPHCCPTHMLNSTCGTSIVMQVAGQFSHDEAMSFVAFARFETTSDPPSFPLGYRLPAANFADSDSKASVWYPGGRSTNEPSTVLMRYTFNEHMQRPWSYGWTSSASAALRNTLHVFKAYLFCSTGDFLQVVGTSQSRGFSIIPYKSAMADKRVVVRAPSTAAAVSTTPAIAPCMSSVLFPCHFVPCACDKPMFNANYIRCNRSNGRKQLRCFPHCCPDHNLHCSCGGPITVAVHVNHPLDGQLVMYAHGERAGEAELALHEEISHDVILSNLHEPGHNDRGDWVPGILQQQQPSASASSQSSTSTRVLYTFNELSTQLGWPYHWKGSATKADRNQQHVFKAYVFQLLPDNQTLRVVNWISSTPFTMSSFRRCNTTPTSRTNKYIQVIPTEISDVRKPTVSRKRSHHDHVDSPTTLLNEINSAG